LEKYSPFLLADSITLGFCRLLAADEFEYVFLFEILNNAIAVLLTQNLAAFIIACEMH